MLPLQGAQKQGIREHVKVKKKFDALGVGAVSWWAPPPAGAALTRPVSG